MGNKTSISWTHRTMNPIRVKDSKTFHCVKRSPACDNCYAEVMSRRLAAMGGTTFYPYKVHREMPELELHREMLSSWQKTKKPYLNFVTSMTDMFGEFVPKEWMFEILDAMVAAHRQVFQCLTKREDVMMATVNEYCQLRGLNRLPENIWMGITVESQKWYDKRVDCLLQTKASVRWLSMEPLLGPVDLHFPGTVPRDWGYGYCHVSDLIHWVVVGGESGLSPKNIRPSNPDWFISIRDQCFYYNVPFFFKQWGNWFPVGSPEKGQLGKYAYEAPMQLTPDMPRFVKQDKADPLPPYLRCRWMQWMPKKQSGELLNGKEHKELPRVAEYFLDNK